MLKARSENIPQKPKMLFSFEVRPPGDKLLVAQGPPENSTIIQSRVFSGNAPSHCLSGECSVSLSCHPWAPPPWASCPLRSERRDTSPCTRRNSLPHSQPEDSSRSGASGASVRPVSNSAGPVSPAGEGSWLGQELWGPGRIQCL